ncbi:MAG TPA: bifunctional homocysteine S-methyltransferase/methylenetetrahydrofolate reductase [Verrucomicrobia bacterium]|nr:bifunctional homocysteine S-methyltransferase/methylenetetrahydrofolate reductase [Verrucomicrobiota bacterium]
MQNLIEKMRETPVVFDGAMGTVIYSRGVFINRCFDEVSLTAPDLIRSIHEEYLRAGADVIETNTFGANRIWLQGYGLAEKTVEINLAGARLAREAAGASAYVAGSVGPCLRAGQILSAEHSDRLADAFRECTEALARGGVDALILETFTNIDELLLAAGVAARTGLPVIASFTLSMGDAAQQERVVLDTLARLDQSPDVHAIGVNCGSGPAPLFQVLEKTINRTAKPVVVMPNAGQPQQVEGRMLYLATPEYFTSYGKKFIEIGARGIGGCCGTTPEHIRDLAKAVHTLGGVKKYIEIKPAVAPANAVAPIPMAAKSRFGGKLARGERVTSIEVLPPRSCDLSAMLQKVRQCYLAGIDAINIPDGPRASARVSPMIASIAIREKVGIEPILHYCCRDRNLIGMQSDLLGGYAAGLTNFLIITGDPPKIGDYPDVTGVFDVDAIGLARMVSNLNQGMDIGGHPINPPCGILIGVGINPCALDLKNEIERFRRKIDAGAEYAITQPVFDAEALFRFIDATSDFSRTVPIVAGIWPLVSFKNAEFMKNEVPGVEVPDSVLERMRFCATREDGIRVGCEIAREIRDKISSAVAGFQVSAPFGNVELAINVLN